MEVGSFVHSKIVFECVLLARCQAYRAKQTWSPPMRSLHSVGRTDKKRVNEQLSIITSNCELWEVL